MELPIVRPGGKYKYTCYTYYVAHLNIYVPDELAETLKKEARSAGVPLSRFMLSRMSSIGPGADWPPGFFTQTCGFLTEDIAEPFDAPPEPVESLGLA